MFQSLRSEQYQVTATLTASLERVTYSPLRSRAISDPRCVAPQAVSALGFPLRDHLMLVGPCGSRLHLDPAATLYLVGREGTRFVGCPRQARARLRSPQEQGFFP